MQPDKSAALRKRTQIANANRMMFLWVAGVSVLFGFASVGTYFLAQTLIFNEKVIAEKNKTISILETNNKNVILLESEIRALDANEALITSKANIEDKALQVILDALPSEVNCTALAASVQENLLKGLGEMTALDPDQSDCDGDSTSNKSVVNASKSKKTSNNELAFSFSIKGTKENLKKALINLEKSIRVIDVTSLKFEDQGDESTLIVQARGFYEPVRVVELKDKTVRQ